MEKRFCKNCGAEVGENFCPRCGQRSSLTRLSWHTLIENFVSPFIGDEAYGLRGVHMRMGAIMTWYNIVFHLPKSIDEYTSGHIRKYFNPVMVVILLSTLYALLYTFWGEPVESIKNEDNLSPLIMKFIALVQYSGSHPAVYSLSTIPFQAIAIRYFYRKYKRFSFVDILYICVFISIVDITLLLVALPLSHYLPTQYYTIVCYATVFLYMAYAMKRLLPISFGRSAWLYAKTLISEMVLYFGLIFVALIAIQLTYDWDNIMEEIEQEELLEQAEAAKQAESPEEAVPTTDQEVLQYPL